MSESRRALCRGELVELTIDKDVYRGRGLGRLDGRVVFVARAYAGDRVRARVSEPHAAWAEAELVEVLEAAPARRPAPCRYAPLCGGCAYQELDVGEQLRVKESVLRESLRRAGVPYDGTIAVRPSPEEGWRMRAALHFEVSAEGMLRLGLRREGTRRVVDVESCLQLSPRMNRAARALRAALAGKAALLAHLRGLDLLESPQGEALVVSLETTLRPHQARELVPLARQVPELSGFGVGCGERLVWLHGAPRIEVEVLGLRLRAHLRSFFQGNRHLLATLAREVRDLLPRDRGRILDLFSGVGLFALPLAARDGGEVVAVERSPCASDDARSNAERAGLGCVRVVTEDVARALAALPRLTGERIVLDPPRSGAGREVVDLLAEREPTAIVYVSCDPATLGRDLAHLASRGYRPDTMVLFDLFPDTFHMETVVRLVRRD